MVFSRAATPAFPSWPVNVEHWEAAGTLGFSSSEITFGKQLLSLLPPPLEAKSRAWGYKAHFTAIPAPIIHQLIPNNEKCQQNLVCRCDIRDSPIHLLRCCFGRGRRGCSIFCPLVAGDVRMLLQRGCAEAEQICTHGYLYIHLLFAQEN